MVRRSGLAERTFKRRFTEATGFASIAYVHRLRVEYAKRRLERTDSSADEISWQVGYEDAAFFRRLFKRFTGMTPEPTAGDSRCRPSPACRPPPGSWTSRRRRALEQGWPQPNRPPRPTDPRGIDSARPYGPDLAAAPLL
jgi:AraC-like DNA-binding protein